MSVWLVFYFSTYSLLIGLIKVTLPKRCQCFQWINCLYIWTISLHIILFLIQILQSEMMQHSLLFSMSIYFPRVSSWKNKLLLYWNWQGYRYKYHSSIYVCLLLWDMYELLDLITHIAFITAIIYYFPKRASLIPGWDCDLLYMTAVWQSL